MKMISVAFIASMAVLAATVGFAAGTAGGQSFVITVPLPRTAVDLELINGQRLILWSDGTLTPLEIPAPTGCPEDIDGDGVVAQPDLLALLAAMGKKCP